MRLTEGKRPVYPYDLADLLLVAEVQSPSNAAYDYPTKRRLYLTSGVPEYWVVSPEAQTFARWRGSEDIGELLSTRIEWQPSGMDASLVIDIPEFFADALG